DHAHLEKFVGALGGHHLDAFAVVQFAVDDADVGDHPAVGVVDGVEDQRACRGVGVADGGGNLLDDLVQELGDADAGLRGDAQYVVGVAADDSGELLGELLRLGAGQVDLVQDRDDVQVG